MQSYPFTSQVTYDDEGLPLYDRAIDSAFLRQVFAQYFSDGIFYKPTNALQVVADTGMQVKVYPGACHIRGAIGIEDAIRKIPISPAGSQPRITTIVARLDLSQDVRSIDLYAKDGTPAATPTAPALTRDSTIWELGLADIKVGANVSVIMQANITDTRLDDTRCGVVAQTIGELDTQPYFAQVQALIDELEAEIDGIEQGSEVMLKAVYDTHNVGKDIFSSIPNPNLADNTNFLDPVNQRGFTSMDGPAGSVYPYTIDRWYFSDRFGSVELTDKGLKITSTGDGLGLMQKVETDSDAIYTLSAKINGEIESISGNPSEGEISSENHRLYIGPWSGDAGIVVIGLGSSAVIGDAVTVEWVKLEKSPFPTVFQPKDFGAELAECLRYCRLYRLDWQMNIGAGTTLVPLAFSPMRSIPTASFQGTPYAFNCEQTGFSLSQFGGAVNLNVSAAGITAFQASVLLSADL